MPQQGKKVHFVGIGGIGMSGIAQLLHASGYHVTGSDMHASENTKRLEQLGISVQIGHRADLLPDCDLLVHTSAVGADNPEIRAALQRSIPVLKRAEMLGQIIRHKSQRIAIAGTHGKTTTTAMVARIFSEAGFDPVVINGGIDRSFHGTTKIGKGDIIIFEADEYDRSFLKMSPTDAIITTLEADHLDCYTDLQDIERTFIQFANSLPITGKLAICSDEPVLQKIRPAFQRSVISYGISGEAELRAGDFRYSQAKTEFTVHQKDKPLGRISLAVPGLHNSKNALGATSIALAYGISFDRIADALAQYRGVQRRFDIRKEEPQIMLVDDYAHHPTEIKATLTAARQGWSRRIIAVFQPHLYSRTRDFQREFAAALSLADIAIVTDIYPAREKPIPGVSAQLILDAVEAEQRKSFYHSTDLADTLEQVRKLFREGDMIITLGAGDIWKLLHQLKESL